MYRILKALVAAALITLVSHSRVYAEDAQPLPDLIGTLEWNLVMPEGAGALGTYTRYYAERDGMLIGIFVRGDDGIRIVPGGELPLILDGGCSVVNLRYNLDTHKLTTIFCNGNA